MTIIKDIAQKAGVSIGTVDRVLHNRGNVNEQTKNRILEIVKELDYKPNIVAQGLAVRKKNLKLGFLIPNSKKHPFYTDIRNAAEKEAKELEQFGVQVTFVDLDFYKMESQSYWISISQQLLEMDGMAVISIEYPEMHDLLKKAEKNNIPVVFYNHYFENEKFLAYVGCNYRDAGRLAAGLCALAGGEDARVCIYSEFYDREIEENSANYFLKQDRLSGFQFEIAERYPDMKIQDMRLLSDNQIDNYLSAQEMLRKYPDTNIVYVENPGDYGICEAIYRADEKQQIRIITNDIVDQQIEMIRKGMISATICQEPDKQGSMPLEILFQYLAYGTCPENQMCYTNLSIHLVQNL